MRVGVRNKMRRAVARFSGSYENPLRYERDAVCHKCGRPMSLKSVSAELFECQDPETCRGER